MDLSVFTQLYLLTASCLCGKCSEHITAAQDGGQAELAHGTLKPCQWFLAGDQSKAVLDVGRHELGLPIPGTLIFLFVWLAGFTCTR